MLAVMVAAYFDLNLKIYNLKLAQSRSVYLIKFSSSPIAIAPYLFDNDCFEPFAIVF